MLLPTLLFPTSLPCTVLTWFTLFTLLTCIECIVNTSHHYLLQYLLVKIALLGTFVAYALCRDIHGDHIEEQTEDSCEGENVNNQIGEDLKKKIKFLKLNHEKSLKLVNYKLFKENHCHVRQLIELYEKLSKADDFVENRQIKIQVKQNREDDWNRNKELDE